MLRERLEVGAEPMAGYRLRQKRGEGGFAEVWEATSPEGTLVALKFVNARLRDAFREVRSIQSIGKLRHPHLIDVHQTWSLPGYVVVSMELGEGSLLDLLEACEHEFGTPLPVEDLLRYMEQAASAIDFLNARKHKMDSWQVGFQHCDIKPSNLMLVDGKVKVADFGLATMMTTQTARTSKSGTIAFAPPEIHQGHLTHRSDQFSLAVSYYMLRTGRLPYLDLPDQFDSKYVHPTPDLTGLLPNEKPVVAQALSTAMGDRWGSCGEFVRALQTRMIDPNKPSNGSRFF